MLLFYTAVAAFLIILRLSSGQAWGAVGCDLHEPGRDVKRLFPGSTGYKAVSLEIQKVGGDKLLARIEAKLRDKLHTIFSVMGGEHDQDR